MNFQGPVVPWLMLAIVPFALPVLLGLILSRFLPGRAGCLSLVALIAIGVLSAFGISAYLDSGGETVQGEVLDKRESIVYHLDGSWNRKMVADVRYNFSYTSVPVTVSLNLLPARFDELRQGDFVQLRSDDLPGLQSITRLEDQTTMPQVWYSATDQPFLFCFVLGVLLMLAIRFVLHSGLPMLFFMSGLVTIGSWWISTVVVPLWQQSDTLLGSLNTVNATVREVHPPYLGSGLQGWLSTKLFTPYDLILLDIVPLARSQRILSVDAADVDSVSVKPGQNLNVEYSTANPRSALIPDANRSYLWKNGLLSTLFSLLAMLGVGKLAFLIGEQTQKPAGVSPPPTRSGRGGF